MKKTLFIGLLLTTLGTVSVNAKAITVKQPETVQTFRYVTSVVTETVGGCKITYKITTKYLLCFVICVTKSEIKRDCSGQGGGN